MSPLNRLAIIGNSLPRRCGIATFTSDLQQAICRLRPEVETAIVAMTDHGHTYDYPAAVRLQVRDEIPEDYARAAEYLNERRFDAVCLQHEFGIFGGESGQHIMGLLSRLTIPIITTCHTVLREPTAMQREVLAAIVAVSSKVIVMAEKGRELLLSVVGAPAEKVEVIPHGIPDYPFLEPDAAKARLGFADRAVILTFGLLSPNKGIEVMIDAMPSILKSRSDAIYVVLGATHPNLIRQEGEAYRERLMERARSLGIGEHVVFLNRFADQATLLDIISMCDVYVTPYLNEAQMTSGTLSYSFGLGKAVVSTPYWHARELLADGRGVLVPFGDAASTGEQVGRLLGDEGLRQAMRRQAYACSRSMTWERTAERYLVTFETARRGFPLKVIPRSATGAAAPESTITPRVQLRHFLSMCDDTGLFQHAVLSVPDRAHGYCVDDNARALLVACALNRLGEHQLSETLIARLAAFIQHAWNPHTQRFRNFMSFERRWLEESGSEDSHGRALWALGECARSDVSASRRQWASLLFGQALQTVKRFQSPRAWAFALLGLDACCAVTAEDSRGELRRLLADKLMALLCAVESSDWVWFEDGLAYDNARLPQALIITGAAIARPDYVKAGLRSLRWLMGLQTSAAGIFRPVGSKTFGDKRTEPKAFDQQPLEATAAISACLAAWRADGDPRWKADATRAFAWFFGSNDLSVPIVDLESGSCRDGLHPDRANENMGGESVVSYLLGLTEVRQLARTGSTRSLPAPLLTLRS